MKRIAYLCLVFCIIAGGMMPMGAWAEDTDYAENISYIYDEITTDLIGYEIISETDAIDTEQPILRKELAKLVLQLFCLDSEPFTPFQSSPFSDVDIGDVYAQYILYGNQIGFLRGYEDGTFRPDNNVEIAEAVKVLVSCLGYDSAIEAEGGYPVGSNRIAARLGITRGVSGQVASRADIFQLFYNALDAQELVSNYSTDPSYSISGEILKEFISAKRKITAGEGVVYGNIVYPGSATVTADVDSVTIGEETYLKGDISWQDLIGQRVKYFVKENGIGRKVVTYAFTLDYNQILELTEDNINSLEGSTLSYYTDGGSAKTARLDSESYMFLYNYRPKAELSLDDLKGEISLIDNDRDGRYEFITAVAADIYRVNSVQTIGGGSLSFQTERWYQGGELTNLRNLESHPEDTVVIIQNSDGEALSLSDIKKDNVLTLIISEDKIFISITVELNAKTGALTGKFEDSIAIDGEPYVLTPSQRKASPPFGIEKLGTYGTFYLNKNNEVIYYVDTPVLTEQYGYVIGIKAVGGFSDEVQLRLLEPGRMSYIYEQYDDGTESRALKAVNSGIRIYTTTARVTLDGSRIQSGQLVSNGLVRSGDIIQYTTNAEGKIHRITTPVAYYGDASSAVSRKFSTFTDTKAENESDQTVFAFGAVNRGGFRVDLENTATFCLPPQPGEEFRITGDANYAISDDEAYFDQVTMNNNTSYYTRAYDFDEDTGKVRVFAIVSGLMADRSDEVLSTESWSIVSGSMLTLNDEGDVVYALEGYRDGKSFTAVSQSGDAGGLSGQLSSLRIGDVFKFTESTQGTIYQISDREDIFSITADITDRHQGFFSPRQGNIYGWVTSIQRKIISETTVRYAHKLEVDYGSGTQALTCSYTDTAIYLYDPSGNGEVSVGSADDIYAAQNREGSRIYAKVDENYNAEILVIILDDSWR